MHEIGNFPGYVATTYNQWLVFDCYFKVIFAPASQALVLMRFNKIPLSFKGGIK